MSRYIDANALREKWLCLQGHDFSPSSFVYSIDNAPTVDAVPVTRCAQCKWWWKVNGLCTHPKHCHDNVCVHECGKDYFCADGERRSE